MEKFYDNNDSTLCDKSVIMQHRFLFNSLLTYSAELGNRYWTTAFVPVYKQEGRESLYGLK